MRTEPNKNALDAGTPSGGNEVAQGSLRNIDDPRLDATYKAAIQNWNRKLHILEAFNGQYFFNLPSEKNETPGASVGMRKLDAGSTPYYQLSGDMLGQIRQTLAIDFAQQQLNLLDESLAALKDSVYGALVLQTRVKPLLDLVELRIDEQGIRLDATALNAEIARRLAADPIHGLSDLLDLDRYAADLLIGSNWDGMAGFDSLIKRLPQTPELSALLNDYKVRQLGAGNDWNYSGNGSGSDNDIVMGGAGNDAHYGNNGNDRLYGEEGDDQLFGGEGNDLLSGGAGNDTLYGDNGADTYVFGIGNGHDTILDHEQNGQRLDAVRFLGLNPADVSVAVDYNDNLLFTIAATGETLRVPYYGNWWGRNGVGQYVFDNGTIWTHDDAMRASVPATTEGDDIILASSADDAIDGKGGNDRLIGQRGNDLIDGGAGNDLLIGSSGLEGYYEDGQWKVRRSQTPNIRWNGEAKNQAWRMLA